MYLEPGHAYVFFNYGAHFMLNVSAEPAGTAGGILIRAVEPLDGIELMKKHRKCSDMLGLTRGPGRLAAAFRINRSHDGVDLCGESALWLGAITAEGARPRDIVIGATVRIGITRAADHVLRFYAAGSPFVSGPKRLLGVEAFTGASKIKPRTTQELKARTKAKSEGASGPKRADIIAGASARKNIAKKGSPSKVRIISGRL
jgi:hypothetical protein